MAILKMKRIRCAVPINSRRPLLRELYSLSCVEIEPLSKDETTDELLSSRMETTNADRNKAEIKKAKGVITSYVQEKKKPIGGKTLVTESELFNERTMDKALDKASEVNEIFDTMETIKADKNAIHTKMQFLSPWVSYDLPVEEVETQKTIIVKGTFPVGGEVLGIFDEVEAMEGAYLCEINRDLDLVYVFGFIHRSRFDEVMQLMRQKGFVREDFQGLTGSVRENFAKLKTKLESLDTQYASCESSLKAMENAHELLEIGFDAYTQEESRDKLLSSIGYTGKTAFFQGWTAEKNMEQVAKVLEKYKAAFEFVDPEEGDFPPTVLESGSIAQPLNPITEMFGMPKYGSIVDPNIVMLPFYVLFLGAIMADVIYGLIMFVGCIVGIKLFKPEKNSGMYNLLRLFTYCGVSTMVFGALTGGYLGDLVFNFTLMMTGNGVFIPPLWFNPLENPMTMLIFSMVLGFIQLLAGMGVSAYRQIRQGDVLGAIFDVGSWYIIFAGAGVAVGGMFLESLKPFVNIGLYVLIGGLALLILTGGRAKKNIFMKAFGGVGKLYNIVGMMSDILSYSRIMALALSGAVVASVVNKMGAMGGGSILGVLLFVAVAIVGHVFNIAIGLLGAYVHTSRLQYIEYFGRWYEDGGRIMKTLKNSTKYTKVKIEK